MFVNVNLSDVRVCFFTSNFSLVSVWCICGLNLFISLILYFKLMGKEDFEGFLLF